MPKENELVDLVDSSGRIQKCSIPRSEADQCPKLHFQIIIGVIHDGNGGILVHKRSKMKQVNPGDVDHVCGAIMSGETPEQAFIREALEETGIKPKNLIIVSRGVNKYKRYRYLLLGESKEPVKKINSDEVEWTEFFTLSELKQKQQTGGFTFVDEFFEDADLALQKL